jgi:hypothetical protein
MESISNILKRKPNQSFKKSLLTEAFIFAKVKNAMTKIVTEYYPEFQDDFMELQTIVKAGDQNQQDSNIKIKIQLLTDDNGFLTWLKMENLDLEKHLEKELQTQQILVENQTIEIKFGKK